MKLLIDTHVLIWWMGDRPQLGSKARSLLSESGNVLLVSVVSIWEITMKWRVRKYPIPGSAHLQFLADEDVSLLGIEPRHFDAVEALPSHHKDPFDQLILAQAQVEGATIMTSDRIMTEYGIPCIPAMR